MATIRFTPNRRSFLVHKPEISNGLIAASVLLFVPALLIAQQDRIAGPIDRGRAVVKGNVNPKAQPQFDRGPVDPSLKLDLVTLALKPTPQQQANLEQLLNEQQERSSPNYHRWLTPEQYADRFGSSLADIAQIVAWLEGQGLTVISTARGRNFVVFKGTAGVVEAALRVEIHSFLVDGEMHYANATEPSVPEAIQPFTIGFFGLDDFKLKPSPQVTKPVPAARLPTGITPSVVPTTGSRRLRAI